MTLKQIKAIEMANKKRILEVCPTATDDSGIYIFTRFEKDFKYAYVGQSKHILTRLAEHLKGYQHIDLSIKKHKLYNYNYPNGWRIEVHYFNLDKLDEMEQEFTKNYANMGYQLRNKTSGGQGENKFGIDENRPKKGYNEGLRKGYENARKEVAKWFKKNLIYQINDKTNKNKEKSFNKFKEFLEVKME